jgi:hypothetical protein
MRLTQAQLRAVIVKVWKRSPALSRIIHPEGFGEDIFARIDTYNIIFSNSYDSRIVDYLDINGEAYSIEGELMELMTAARKTFRDDINGEEQCG